MATLTSARAASKESSRPAMASLTSAGAAAPIRILARDGVSCDTTSTSAGTAAKRRCLPSWMMAGPSKSALATGSNVGSPISIQEPEVEATTTNGAPAAFASRVISKLLPGFDEANYGRLRELVAGWSDVEKQVVLQSDEMPCNGGLFYDTETDKNYGVEGKASIVLFIISGLRKPWSYVVGYSVVALALVADVSEQLFIEHFRSLRGIGLTVVAVVTDMYAPFRKALIESRLVRRGDLNKIVRGNGRAFLIHCMKHVMRKCLTAFNGSKIDVGTREPANKMNIQTLSDDQLKCLGINRTTLSLYFSYTAKNPKKKISYFKKRSEPEKIFFSERCVSVLKKSVRSSSLESTIAFIDLMKQCIEVTSEEKSTEATRDSLISLGERVAAIKICHDYGDNRCFKVLSNNLVSMAQLLEEDPHPLLLRVFNTDLVEEIFYNIATTSRFAVSVPDFIRTIPVQATLLSNNMFYQAQPALAKLTRDELWAASKPAKGICLAPGIFYEQTCACCSRQEDFVKETTEIFERFYLEHRLEPNILATMLEYSMEGVAEDGHRACKEDIARHLIMHLIIQDNNSRINRTT